VGFPEKLYVVARPAGTLAQQGEYWQRLLSAAYSVYERRLPPLHVTIEVVEVNTEVDLPLAVKIIEQVTGPVPAFTVEVEGFSCFPAPYKSINLNVKNAPELVRLSQNLNRALKRQGFGVREGLADWQFHITLINPRLGENEWTELEFGEACELMEHVNLRGSFPVDHLELWYPRFSPALEVAGVFPLKPQESGVRSQESEEYPVLGTQYSERQPGQRPGLETHPRRFRSHPGFGFFGAPGFNASSRMPILWYFGTLVLWYLST
jgi:2'-5' RNA ligase